MNASKLFTLSSSAAFLSLCIAAGYGSAIASQQLKVNPSATVQVKPSIKVLLGSAFGFGLVALSAAITNTRHPIPNAQKIDYRLEQIIDRLKLAASDKRGFYINQLISELGGDRFSIIELLKSHNLIDQSLYTELVLWAESLATDN